MYRERLRALPREEHRPPDVTGWLHARVGTGLTCFAIDPHRGASALGRVIGLDWEGAVAHDGAAYDRFVATRHQQCDSLVVRRVRDLEELQWGRARLFPCQVIALFEEALAKQDQYLYGELGRDRSPSGSRLLCGGASARRR